MIYNPRILFSQVVFRRDKAEGRMLPQVEPTWIPMDHIQMFRDGEIDLTDGMTIYVEQDNEQINERIIQKLEEQEEYNKMMRDIERMGLDPDSTVESD